MDDFSDGNFDSDPSWAGDTANFEIDAENKLHLNAPSEADVSYLSTESSVSGAATWQFDIELDFNPSSSNLAEIYLMSNNSALDEGLEGYFVRIGGTSDEVSLYRKSGNSSTEIIDGLDDRVDLSTINVSILVTKDGQSNWELFTNSDGINFLSEGTVLDNTFTQSTHFGVLCDYTSTRSDLFRFDNFLVEEIIVPDTIPPLVIGISVLDEDEITLGFSEMVNAGDALNSENYLISRNIGTPSNVSFVNSDSSSVELSFADAFDENMSYEITISGVTDLSGNVISDTTMSFVYINIEEAVVGDILINEIMADPSPREDLPESEFVEIFNKSGKTASLKGWEFSDESTSTVLDSVILFPFEFLILCPAAFMNEFTQFGKVLGLNPWPTLNNSGDNLKLVSAEMTMIDSVNYDIAWYRDSDKDNGGWTLELINPNLKCIDSENWVTSVDPKGGSPGIQNSVFDITPDNLPPNIIGVSASDSRTIEILVSEPLNQSSIEFAEISIEPDLDIDTLYLVNAENRMLEIKLESELSSGIVYTLGVANVTDCSGNLLSATEQPLQFVLPESADGLDLVINEILFDPFVGGVEFIELYNRSDKFINLKNWKLANYEEDSFSNEKVLAINNLIFSPKTYLAFSKDSQILNGYYPDAVSENLIDVNSLPSLPNEMGGVAVVNTEGEIIDAMRYEDSYHHELLSETKGVSLERIDSNGSSIDPFNWQSAASTVGFATPGFQNSQYSSQGADLGELVVRPEVFTPDGDGVEDHTNIEYNFGAGGKIANIKIFDRLGRHIKSIANNSSLSASGFFTWDGTDNNFNKVRMGYYIIVAEIFDTTGVSTVLKSKVVVATRF